jgi:hypothetical protein
MVMRERAAGRYQIPTEFDDVSTETLQFICGNAKHYSDEKSNDLTALHQKTYRAFFTLLPLILVVGGTGLYLYLNASAKNELLVLLCFVCSLAMLGSSMTLFNFVTNSNVTRVPHEPARYFGYKSFTRSRDAHRRYLRKEIEIVQSEITLKISTYNRHYRNFRSAMNWLMGMLIANFGITILYFLVLA